MEADLFRILYCSRNLMNPASSEADLVEILAAARRNNPKRGVTGALLYNAGIFAQILEGDFDGVQSIFEQIQIDDRHGDVVVLQAQPVSERLFADWSMAFAEPSDPIGANALLLNALVDKSGDGSAVLDLLDKVVNRESKRSTVLA